MAVWGGEHGDHRQDCVAQGLGDDRAGCPRVPRAAVSSSWRCDARSSRAWSGTRPSASPRARRVAGAVAVRNARLIGDSTSAKTSFAPGRAYRAARRAVVAATRASTSSERVRDTMRSAVGARSVGSQRAAGGRAAAGTGDHVRVARVGLRPADHLALPPGLDAFGFTGTTGPGGEQRVDQPPVRALHRHRHVTGRAQLASRRIRPVNPAAVWATGNAATGDRLSAPHRMGLRGPVDPDEEQRTYQRHVRRLPVSRQNATEPGRVSSGH